MNLSKKNVCDWSIYNFFNRIFGCCIYSHTNDYKMPLLVLEEDTKNKCIASSMLII